MTSEELDRRINELHHTLTHERLKYNVMEIRAMNDELKRLRTIKAKMED